MGTFAVLSRDGLDVPVAHLNLWCLPGAVGVNRFLFDVGLHVHNNGDKPIGSFDVLLPCGTADKLTDLATEMLDLESARLIFGHDVQISGSQLAVKKGPPFPVVRTSLDSERIAKRSGRNHSYWQLKLVDALAPGDFGYIRVRFEVIGLGRVWNWKRHALGRRGVLLDLRVADFREMSVIPEWSELDERVMLLPQVFLFVVLPWKYHLQAASPELHYVRLLEGEAWRGYLRRRIAIFSAPKLAISEWRYNDVATANPMRVLLDATREPPVGAGRVIVTTAILATVLVGLIWRLPLRFEFIREAWGWLVGIGLVSVLLEVLRNLVDPSTGRYVERFRGWFRKLEDRLYGQG